MLLYASVALWPLLVQWISSRYVIKIGKKQMGKGFYIMLAMLPIFILLAFRNPSLGADTGTYNNNFLYVSETPLSEVIEGSRMEVGYLAFIKLISFFTQSPLVYQVICVSIYAIGMFSFARRLDINDAFLFLYFFCTLGLFTFMFTGIRQCLAMSICLFAYKYCERKQFIRFCIFVVLAYFFHKSAILFLVVYFISGRKISLINTAIYGILVFVSWTYLSEIQEWFNEQLEYQYEIEETGSGEIFLALIILITVFSIFMIYYNKSLTVKSKAFINVGFITVFFWILRIQTRVAERPSYYFLFFSCAMLAYALNNIKDKTNRAIFKTVLISVTLLLYIYRFATNFSSLLPYSFY